MMNNIILLCYCVYTAVNMDIITTGGISVVLLTLMPLQSGAFPLDILEDDVGLLPTRTPRTESPYYGTTPAPDWEKKLKKSYKECEEATGINKALVKTFKSGYFKAGVQIQDWALCVLNRMDLMTLQGVFRYDTALDYIRRDVGHNAQEVKKASAIINKCLTDKLLTPGQIAWEYLRCHRKRDYRKKYPSLGILLQADLRNKKSVTVLTTQGFEDFGE